MISHFIVRRRIAQLGWVSSLFFCAMGASANAQDDHYPQVLRYNEDYSYLSETEQHDDDFDSIKYIPLDNDPDVYLSLHGEFRERMESTHNPQFTLTGAPSDTVLQHRLLLGADLHLGPSVRIFTQLGLHDVSGRKGGALTTDKDHLDLQQAFIDVTQPLGTQSAGTLRLGRQEMLFGSGRLVAIREGPNVRRSFDGVRAIVKTPKVDVSLFATRPVTIRPGTFDDPTDDDQAFWGLYTTSKIGSGNTLDLYYMGLEKERSVYANGVGKEHRHTLGGRFSGRVGAIDYNSEAAWQFGRIGGQDIKAFTLSFDGGYTMVKLPWQPRLGIKANVESGDSDPTDGKLETFNPLFPNHAYFSEAGFGAPMNSYDIQPNLTLQPAPKLTLVIGTDFFWRYSQNDAVYTSILLPLPNTAAVNGRYIGTMLTSHLRWRPTRHWEFNLDYSSFDAGEVIRNAGGRDASFFMASAAYRF